MRNEEYMGQLPPLCEHGYEIHCPGCAAVRLAAVGDASDFKETDEPHSEAGHNPYWCGGNCAGQACGDDPCWSCIAFLHAVACGFVASLTPERVEPRGDAMTKIVIEKEPFSG
jgi:hypothetical protein